MEKDEAIAFLEKCETIEKQYADLESKEKSIMEEIRKLDEKPYLPFHSPDDSIVNFAIKMSFLISLFGGTFLLIIINFVFFALTPNSYKSNPFYIFVIIFSCIVVIALSIPIAIRISKKEKLSSIAEFEEYQQKLAGRPNLVHELEEVKSDKEVLILEADKMMETGILHPDYFPYTYELMEYLKKGRADTLKEAINLLEQDIADAERNQREQEFREEMRTRAETQENALQNISRQTRKAASAAKSTARWSMISTIIAAQKNKKDHLGDDD